MKINASVLAFSIMLASFPALAGVNSGDDSRLRLELSRLEVFIRTNRLEEARDLLTLLKVKYPENADIYVAEADLNLQAGNRGAALASLSTAQSFDTENADIAERREQVRQPDAFISADGEVKSTNNSGLEQISRLSGQARYANNYALGATIENNRARVDPFARENGAVARFEGNRQRLTLNGAYVNSMGNEAKAFIYATKKTLGAGVKYTRLDTTGATEILANIFAPEWNYLESVVGYGTRDDVRVSRTQYFTPSLKGRLGTGINHYGLEDDRDLATSAMVSGELNYNLPNFWRGTRLKPIDNTALALNYTLDAEYVFDVEEKNSALGRYKPFPLSTYEVHGITLSATSELRDKLYLDAFGGWAFDRLGGDGPQFGGFITYAPDKGPQLQLRASRGISGARASDRFDHIGVNAAWKF